MTHQQAPIGRKIFKFLFFLAPFRIGQLVAAGGRFWRRSDDFFKFFDWPLRPSSSPSSQQSHGHFRVSPTWNVGAICRSLHRSPPAAGAYPSGGPSIWRLFSRWGAHQIGHDQWTAAHQQTFITSDINDNDRRKWPKLGKWSALNGHVTEWACPDSQLNESKLSGSL